MGRHTRGIRTLAFGLVLCALETVRCVASPVSQLNPSSAVGDWLYRDTEHLRIIYQDGHQAAADTVAGFGDSVFEDVADYVGYAPPERIPVVLQAGPAHANGFYAPAPNRVALNIASPSYPMLGTGHSHWLELVLTHELTHYMHLTSPVGIFGLASRLFGPAAVSPATLWMPGWYVEGLPVNAETDLTAGGRGSSSLYRMLIIASAVEDEWYSYDQAAIPSPFPPPGRPYLAGYLFVNYLQNQYGSDAPIRLHRRYAQAPYLGMRRAFRKTFGRPAPEAFQTMTQEISRRYRSRLRIPSGEPLHGQEVGSWYVPVVTDRGLFGYRSSPDGGHRLVFRTVEREGRGGTEQDWDPVGPLSITDPWSFDVSPSADRIVYTRFSTDPAARGGTVTYSDVYIRDIVWPGGSSSAGDISGAPASDSRPWPPQLGRERPLTQERKLYHPRFDLTQNRIVAVERNGSYSSLVGIDLESGATEQLFTEPESIVRTPTVDRGSGRIAFTVIRSGGRQELAIAEFPIGSAGRTVRESLSGRAGDGAMPTTILAPPEGARDWYYPRFSPEGKLLAAADPQGFLEVYRVQVDGTTAQPLDIGAQAAVVARDPVGAYEAVLIGDQVMYGTYRTAGYRVRIAALPDSAGPVEPVEGSTMESSERRGQRSEASSARGKDPGNDPGSNPGAVGEPDRDPGSAGDPDRDPGAVSDPPYRSVPTPQLWLPTMDVTLSSLGETELDLGALILLADPLGHHYLQVSAAYNFRQQQPSGQFMYSLELGPWGLEFSLFHDYSVDLDLSTPRTTSVTTASVVARRHLWSSDGPLWNQGVTGYGRAGFNGLMQAMGESSLADMIASDGIGRSRSASLGVGAEYSRSRFSPAAALYGSGRTAVTVEAAYFLPRFRHLDPVDDAFSIDAGRGVVARMDLEHRLPIGRHHTVVQFDLETAASTTGSSAALIPMVDPQWQEADGDGKVAAGVSVRAPVGLYDWAWRGLAVTGLGMTGFARQAGYVDVPDSDATEWNGRLEPFWVTGGTLEVPGYLWAIPATLSVGVALQMPPWTATDPFVPEDFRILANVTVAGIDLAGLTR